MTTEELSKLGLELYELIKGISGYEVAMVDWDADRLIGVEELIEEFSEDVVDGNLDGLVVSHNVRELFPKSDHFVPFDDEHDWIPYKGTRAFR